MTSSRQSEQNRSSSCHLLDTSDGDPEPVQRSQSSCDPANSRHVAPAGTSSLTRQPGQLQSRPSQAVHRPLPVKQNQTRPPVNVTKDPNVPQAVRMTPPPNLQTVRHSLQHQKLPQLAQQQQQQQHVQNKQQQRLASSEQANTGAVSPGKRMDAAHFMKPSIQSQTSHQQNPSQGLTSPNKIHGSSGTPNKIHGSSGTPNKIHGSSGTPNKIHGSSGTPNKAQQSQPPPRGNFLHNAPRPLPQQSQCKVFSVPQNQEHPQRQKPAGDRIPLRHPPELDEQVMYDDEDDDAYNEDIDEEEMRYPGFPGSFDYDFNSSDDDDDDDELSEEESALLEELRFCDDDERYSEIIDRLHEKGIDPEEIEELLYHGTHQLDMYSKENYPGDASGDEDEAEGTVSSSSQSQLPQIRHHPRTLPAPGHALSVASSMPTTQLVGFNKKPTGVAPSSIPATSRAGLGPQRGIPSPHASPRQLLQQVSGAGHVHASGHIAPQVQPAAQQQQRQKQQFELKLTGQPKKIFQNNPSQLTRGTLHANVRQPQEADMLSQLPMEDSDSPEEDDSYVRQTDNTDDQNSREINTLQAQSHTEGARLQTGRHISSGPQRTVGASNKADENQTVNRQSTPLQQQEAGSPVGQPVGTRGLPHKVSQNQVRSAGQQETYRRAQFEDATRPGTSAPQSGGAPQNMLSSPKLKAVLEKTTAPSEASLARLNVEYMQQSLDQEIKAKKTVHPPAAHFPGQKNLNMRHPSIQQRHHSPLHKHPPGHSHQPSSQQNQISPAGQPRHQLPPRQPIPAIVNPNSNTNSSSSTSKPVCSVVPFTLENQLQTVSKNVPKASPQNETFIRPQNPVSSPPQDSANSLSPSPGALQNRPKTSAPLQNPAPLAAAAAGPNIALNTSTKPGNTAALSSSQISTPSQAKPAQVQAQQTAPTQALQAQPAPTQALQTHAQAQPTPTQAQQTHAQGQPSPTKAQQSHAQPAQAPTQAQQTHAQAQPAPTQTQQTHTQAPSQTQPAQAQPVQAPSQTHAQVQPAQAPSQTQTQAPSQTQQTQAQVSSQIQQTQAQAQPVQVPSQTQAQAQPAQAPTQAKQAQAQSTQAQPAQAQASKADSFSVDRLSKDKCVITGKGNQSLVANMVYQIRSPIDGSYVLALWNGEKFEDLKQTGLTTASGAPPGEKTRSDRYKVHTGQATAGGAASNQSTYVKPLKPGHAQHRQEQSLSNCDDEDEDEDDNDDESVFKKPFVEQQNEDYCRVCPFCGYTSTNLKRCESCRRIFRGDIKIIHINKQPAQSASRSESRGDTQSVRSAHKENGGKVAAGNQVRSAAKKNPNVPSLGQDDSDGSKGCLLKEGLAKRKVKDEDDDDLDSGEPAADAERNMNSLGSNNSGPEKRPTQGNSKDAAPRKRQRRLDDTVTISSDEDEPSSTSNNLLSSHAVSPASHAGSKPPSFLFPQPRPVKSLGKLRQEPTCDEEGNSKVDKKDQQHPIPQYLYRPGEAEEEDEEEDGELEGDDEGEEPPMYEIDIRSVRVGSMRTQPEGPLLISLEGVCIKVRSERTEEIFDFEILAHEVEKVKYFLGEIQPVLYLFVSQDCGEKLRSICHMEAGDEEYFDPSTTDMKQKMIVVIIEGFSYMSQEMLRETLSLWADLNQVEDEHFIQELTDEESNDLLIQSAPPVLTMDIDKDLLRFRQRDMKKMAFGSSTFPSSSDNNDNEPDSTSSSPPEVRCHYYGSSIRLLQYPPPPAKRLSITTEDLFCLTEGEFLNDVIIDFYLQYLYLEKLSEENRKRTHIFSSFFYKRLMQKDRHDRAEEDAKKSLPERRHARVKKWTKTVDLFSKDFIVIPINENSHWYLAVICFPGMSGPEAVSYIPSATHMEDSDEDTSDVPGVKRRSRGSASRGPAYRTILGHQLDASEGLDSKDIKPLVGQKQPCILMLTPWLGPAGFPTYLQCEWNAKKSEARQVTKILRSCTPDVPQQSNFSDCGVYLLQYVESFFEDPIADFEIPMEGLEHWFPEEIVHNKRREIHELIMSLHRQYQMERGDPNILYLQFESTPREPAGRFYPDYDMMSGHEEEMNYDPNEDMMSRLDEDVNYDPRYEMASRLGEDMNYDPSYEMASRPDEDINYEANGDHENSNSGLSEEANVGDLAPPGVAVEDNV